MYICIYTYIYTIFFIHTLCVVNRTDRLLLARTIAACTRCSDSGSSADVACGLRVKGVKAERV